MRTKYLSIIIVFFAILIDCQACESCVQIRLGDEFRIDSLTFGG